MRLTSVLMELNQLVLTSELSSTLERAVQLPRYPAGPTPQHRVPFPGQVIAQEAHRFGTRPAGQIAEGCVAAPEPGAEQGRPVSVEITLSQEPPGRDPGRRREDECHGTRRFQGTSWRAASAWLRVRPSM